MSDIDIEDVLRDAERAISEIESVRGSLHGSWSRHAIDGITSMRHALDQLDKENERLTKERDEWKAAAVRSVNDTLRTKHAAMQEAIVEAVRRAEPVGGIDDIIEPLLPHFHMPEPEPVDPTAEDPIDALVQLLAPVLTHGQGMAARERESRFRNAMAALSARGIELRKIGEGAARHFRSSGNG